MEKKNSYQVFMEEAPEQAAAFNGLIGAMALPNGLDQRLCNSSILALKHRKRIHLPLPPMFLWQRRRERPEKKSRTQYC